MSRPPTLFSTLIRDLAYFDSHSVCIKVCDIPHKTEFKRNIGPLETQNLSELCLQWTCAVITLCEHQPVSLVCACMAEQQSQHFCMKK